MSAHRAPRAWRVVASPCGDVGACVYAAVDTAGAVSLGREIEEERGLVPASGSPLYQSLGIDTIDAAPSKHPGSLA